MGYNFLKNSSLHITWVPNDIVNSFFSLAWIPGYDICMVHHGTLALTIVLICPMLLILNSQHVSIVARGGYGNSIETRNYLRYELLDWNDVNSHMYLDLGGSSITQFLGINAITMFILWKKNFTWRRFSYIICFHLGCCGQLLGPTHMSWSGDRDQWWWWVYHVCYVVMCLQLHTLDIILNQTGTCLWSCLPRLPYYN